MNLKILFFFLFVISLKSYSQNICGTPAPLYYQTFENNSKQQSPNEYFCINISFHIVKKANGSGGFPASDIPNLLELLNEDYNQYGIYFKELTIDSISNDIYYDLEYSENNRDILNNLFNENDEPNAIDLFLVGSIIKNTSDGPLSLSGIASDVLSTDLVIKNIRALSNTSTHELGHALNLLHTHEDKYGIENIERTGNNKNCDSLGDKLCDTPADPKLDFSNDVDLNCQYFGGETLNGLPYDPDTHNYMSYSRKICRDEFTPGQVGRMKAALANSYILQPVISSSCAIPVIGGPGLVCNSTTYALHNGGSNIVWEISSNLQEVSSSGSSITVEPVHPTANGDGYVKAIVNNATYTKNLWVRTAVASNFSYVSKLETGLSDPFSAGNCEDIAIKLNIRPDNFGDIIWERVTTNYTISEEGTEYAIIAPFSEGSLQFRVKIQNFCGWSQWLYYQINVSDCSGGGFSYQVSPNPASSEINIATKAASTESNSPSQSLVFQPVSRTAKLLDFNGAFVKDVVLDPYGTTRMDVSNLKEGMYFLKIQVREEEETYKIIVRH